jgi:predicted PurR-regulated permease PerM
MGQVNWSRTRDILISLICIGIILWYAWGLLFGLFVHAVILLLLSMAVAFLLTPTVNYLQKNNMPRLIATLIMYAFVLIALGALAYALVFSLIQQILTFQVTVVNYANALPDRLTALEKFLVDNGIPQSSIDDALNQIRGQATAFATALANNVLNIALIVTNTFIDILLIVVLSFYFTLDGKRIRDNLIGITPKRWMPHVLLFEDALNRVVGNYIRGQLTLAVIIGVLGGVGSAWLGLSSYALIIGVLAFVFETIPMVGPTLASIPAILISLILPDPFPRTFWIVIYFIIVQMLESYVLGPRIVGHAVGLHPIASILALIIGAQLFGAFGALLATPIVGAAWVVIASLYRSARGETADQIMAHRRSGWVIRPPNNLLPRRRRTGPLSNGSNSDVGLVSVPVHEEEAVSKTPAQQETTFTHVKGTSIPLEHIDLLRPVPTSKEDYASKAGNEEEQ